MILPVQWSTKFDWNQYLAVGRHLASYAAGGVTVAVAFGLLSQKGATDLNADIELITSGTQKIVEGIVGIIGILTPIYTSLCAAKRAGAAAQQASVANMPDRMVLKVDPSQKPEAALAAARLPQVQTVITTAAVAAATPSVDKIVGPQAIGATQQGEVK